MADVKISQLPSATLPLTGAELVPLVQGGVTKNVPTTSLLSAPIAGNLNFTGTGNRITGDFSNATVANRVAFQGVSGTTTDVGSIPPTSATAASFIAFNSTDSGNSGFAQLRIDGGDARFASSRTGTGTFLPMTFYTGGSERVRIPTAGGLSVGTTIAPPVGGINVTPAAGSAALDSSPATVTLANGATQTFPSSSGMLLVSSRTSGSTYVYICGGGNVATVSSVGAAIGTFTFNGTSYVFTNNTGGSASYNFMFLRTREAA